MKIISRVILTASTAVIFIMLSGCSLKTNNSSDLSKDTSYNNNTSVMGKGNIDFQGDTIDVKGTGVSFSGTTVNISDGGEYTFTGQLNSGQIVVDSNSDVTLIFNGISISNENDNTIYIKSGDVTIKTIENSDNIVTSGKEETSEESLQEKEETGGAAIYAEEDLIITGSGRLIVNGHINNGIQSKEKLCIQDSEITVVCSNDGIKGKAEVSVMGGNINITSGGDGIQSDGDMDILAGNFNIISGGGSENADFPVQGEKKQNGERPEPDKMPEDGEVPEPDKMPENGERPKMGQMPENEEKPKMGQMPEGGEKPEDGGELNQSELNEQSKNADNTSTKGIKADGTLSISDGIFVIDSLDDGLHSNKKILITDGDFTINSGDDGIHADEKIIVDSGNINIEKCNEGMEAVNIEINGGKFNVKSYDDGLNANSSDKEISVITINSGTFNIDAEGDGLDSNGNIFINGGDITVNGSSNGGDSAIDYGSENGGKCTISGGNVIATGRSNMAESFDADGSKQCSLLYVFESEILSGSEIRLTDEKGNTLISFNTVKNCDSVILSCADLELNKTYTIEAGGQSGKITFTDITFTNKSKLNGRMDKKGA